MLKELVDRKMLDVEAQELGRVVFTHNRGETKIKLEPKSEINIIHQQSIGHQIVFVEVVEEYNRIDIWTKNGGVTMIYF